MTSTQNKSSQTGDRIAWPTRPNCSTLSVARPASRLNFLLQESQRRSTLRSMLFFGLVVISTPLGARTIDDFAWHPTVRQAGFGSATSFYDDENVLTGQRDVTVNGDNFFSDQLATEFTAAGFGRFAGWIVGYDPKEGFEFPGIDLVYDGLDYSSDIDVLNQPFDLTDGGHDRFLVDVLDVRGELPVVLGFGPGLSTEMYTLEKEISEPGTYEFEFEDFVGTDGLSGAPSSASFFTFSAIKIRPGEAMTLSRIYTGTGVPEPSSFLLLAIGVTIVSGRSQRKTS